MDTLTTRPVRTIRVTAWWAACAACLVVFVWLRFRAVGHLLLWDEAVDLMASQAFSVQTITLWSSRFWYHPPAYLALVSLLDPLENGFAERAEMLSIIINAAAWAAMVWLNRRVLGSMVALWSAFFLAVMPCAVFFDVWIKGGSFVALFSLCAIMLLWKGMPLMAASCLGFAFLDKETAVLLAFSAGLLTLADRRFRHAWTLVAMAAIVPAISAWWFIFFSNSTRNNATFAVVAEAWYQPWHFYLAHMPHTLGIPACALALLGIVCLLARLWRAGRGRWRTIAHRPLYRSWPLVVALPSYLLLSALPSKVPWVTTAFHPALATLAGMGMAWLCAAGGRMSRLARPRSPAARMALGAFRYAFIAAVAVFSVVVAARRTHEAEQQALGCDFWDASHTSFSIAQKLNSLATNDQSVLFTTFHFLGDGFDKMPCPVFEYYLRRDVGRSFVRHTLTADQCVQCVLTNHIDWVVLSPNPKPGLRDLLLPLKNKYGLTPVKLPCAWIFNTTALYTNSMASTPNREPGN